MIRQAYCSLDALEEIYTFQDEPDYQTLYQVLGTHHRILVHLSEDEWEEKLNTNRCLTFFAKRAASSPAHDLDYESISCHDLLQTKDNNVLAGTVFIVEETPEDCAKWRAEYGAFVVSSQSIKVSSGLTLQLARKDIRAGQVFNTCSEGSNRTGWNAVLTPRLQPWQNIPLNALVVVDNYLLGENGDKLKLGTKNLSSLLDAILPHTLITDFHLLLVTNNGGRFLKSKNLTVVTESIRASLQRTYPIKIGVLTRENGLEHRRALISNFFFGASHHGFSCFKEDTAQWANDLIVSGLFSGISEPGYDVPWVSMHNELVAVKKRLNHNISLRNPNAGYDDPVHLAFGFCDNRLLDLV